MANLSSVLRALAAIALLAKDANAGTSANVKACVELPTEPASPVIYAFKNGDHHCMYEYLFEKNVTVNTAGITCSLESVHISSKASSSGGDLCATDDSSWDLGFNAYDSATKQPTGQTGAISTKWNAPILSSDHVTISGSPAVVCSTPSDCNHQKMSWHGTPDIYFIFKPFASVADDEFPVEDDSAAFYIKGLKTPGALLIVSVMASTVISLLW